MVFGAALDSSDVVGFLEKKWFFIFLDVEASGKAEVPASCSAGDARNCRGRGKVFDDDDAEDSSMFFSATWLDEAFWMGEGDARNCHGRGKMFDDDDAEDSSMFFSATWLDEAFWMGKDFDAAFLSPVISSSGLAKEGVTGCC